MNHFFSFNYVIILLKNNIEYFFIQISLFQFALVITIFLDSKIIEKIQNMA